MSCSFLSFLFIIFVGGITVITLKSTRMKKIFLFLLPLLALACGDNNAIRIEIHNPSAAARAHETIEIDWQDITSRNKAVTPDNVIVLNARRQQVPSQVVYEGKTEPQLLIFQVSLPGAETVGFTITSGQRETYPTQAYGRFVPERADDYAWENNLAAYRVYGPALKDPQTPGIDVWVKSTERMVIDDWYAGKDYHTNHGEGMDAYKVGPTLGGGASAPWAYGQLWLSGNYAEQQTLDNGPIRTTVRLTYSSTEMDSENQRFNSFKIISLDANSYFNKITDTYAGTWESYSLAAGIMLHDVKDQEVGTDYIAVTEALSDSKQPEIDGNLSLGIILPGAEQAEHLDGHLIIAKRVDNGQPFTYWSGSGWSQAGIVDHGEWISQLLRKREQIESPALVTFQ